MGAAPQAPTQGPSGAARGHTQSPVAGRARVRTQAETLRPRTTGPSPLHPRTGGGHGHCGHRRQGDGTAYLFTAVTFLSREAQFTFGSLRQR